jgi:hypothetical protein
MVGAHAGWGGVGQRGRPASEGDPSAERAGRGKLGVATARQRALSICLQAVQSAPQAAAHSTAAARLSVGEATPPEAITLMQWAPLRSSSRAARRTCGSRNGSVDPSQRGLLAGGFLPPSQLVSLQVWQASKQTPPLLQ